MAMALLNFFHLVRAISEAVRFQLARPGSQSHGAAELVDAFQLAKLENDAMRSARIELCRVGVFQTADVARELDDEGLHTATDSEIRYFSFARIADHTTHSVHDA